MCKPKPTGSKDGRQPLAGPAGKSIRDLELAPPDTTSMRSIWYLLSFVLLIPVTALILTALFTNNWQRSVASTQPSYQFITSGLWFKCRHVSVYWLNNQADSFCTSLDFSESKSSFFLKDLSSFFGQNLHKNILFFNFKRLGYSLVSSP